MQDATLVIGPVALQDFEIPEKISFGGCQALAVHRLIGGERVIDVLGRDDANIVFKGTFSGQDAAARARMLDGLRTSGQEIPLIWDAFYFTVVLEKLQIDYRNPWWIPFEASCVVLRDEAAAPAFAATSLITEIVNDLGQASAFATQGGSDLSEEQTSITTPAATVRGSGSYIAATASLSGGVGKIGAKRDTSGASTESTSSLIVDGSAASVQAISDAADAAERTAALTVALAYLGRANTSLAGAST